MRWLYYKLFGNISDEPKQLLQFSETGKCNLAAIEKRLGYFFNKYSGQINAFYLFRYWQDSLEPQPLYDHAIIPDRHYCEFIRLRFRVEDADYEWALNAFHDEVITPLEKEEGCLKGWRFYEGYEARDDVGARFGDLAHGVDPTEQIVQILTDWTRLRFYFLEHPDFEPNYDVIHLYYNIMGLLYPEELDELEARAAKIRGLMKSVIAF
jgi:hypothetical protein